VFALESTSGSVDLVIHMLEFINESNAHYFSLFARGGEASTTQVTLGQKKMKHTDILEDLAQSSRKLTEEISRANSVMEKLVDSSENRFYALLERSDNRFKELLQPRLYLPPQEC